jgi:predicted 2-oxoglutarate/Fe(II)-dependent dioxygenase YbiX
VELQELVETPRIFVIHDFLSREECERFIALCEGAGFTDAPITTSLGFVIKKDVRNNERVMVDDPALAAELWSKAKLFVPQTWSYWEAAGLNERFRYYRYDPGQTFAPHYDGYFERPNGQRSHLTFMVYLNDGFEGGDTIFHQCRPPLCVRPECGKALVFYHQQLHEGAPVLSGRKYVLRTDVMYKRLSGNKHRKKTTQTWCLPPQTKRLGESAEV